MIQPDLFDAVTARDEALERVIEPNLEWADRAESFVIASTPRGWTGMGEDLRHWVEKGVGSPHHQNAWGAFIARLVRHGIIRPTGEFRAPKDKRSHASYKRVYCR